MLLLVQIVTGDVGFARHLHALLIDERMQQLVQRLHNRLLAVDFERAILFDTLDSLCLNVSRNNSRKGTPQISCQQMQRLIAGEIERSDIFMFWLKWLLKLVIDVQNPVEVVGIGMLAPEDSIPAVISRATLVGSSIMML
jgi:hypothetical protein